MLERQKRNLPVERVADPLGALTARAFGKLRHPGSQFLIQTILEDGARGGFVVEVLRHRSKGVYTHRAEPAKCVTCGMRWSPQLLARSMAIAWAIAFALSPAAQAQITGRVVDDASGEPLPNAHVLIRALAETAGPIAGSGSGSGTGTATDLDGRFAFPNAAPGTGYILTTTYVNFHPRVDTVTAPAALTVLLTEREILHNPITITASRRPERKLEAPARVTVIDAEQLRTQAPSALTIADHLQAAPSVDIIKTGLNQSRVVIRGFNDNLSSSVLTLLDNRVTQVPAVRLTALQLLPATQHDVEQIEVVAGPASALYGPNAANGVLHVVTKSPHDAPGTHVALTGGQQDILAGSLRHAARINQTWAYKVTAQRYTGQDFEYTSPVEEAARRAAVEAGTDPGLIAQRDTEVRNTALTARVEGRFPRGTTLTLDAGRTKGHNIEVTPTGAAQIRGASMAYTQLRLRKGSAFAQVFGNFLDSGDSYFLRTGERFIDKSRLLAAQVQDRSSFRNTELTYGADWFRTIPRNEGTVSGGYEDDDIMDEPGVYLQADTDLSSQWALTLAGRVDYHSRLEYAYFSPRAAVVFKPRSTQNVRLTYNRAFKSPASNELFGDVLGLRDAFGLSGLGSVFGVSGRTDIRAQGMITGFSFPRSQSGLPQFRSPFASDPQRLIDLNDPAFTAQMWDIARLATVLGLGPNLAESGIIPAEQAPAVAAALEAVLPGAVQGVQHQLQVLDLDAQQFFAVAPESVQDLPPLGITRTETIELGYQGLLGQATLVTIDGYWSRIRDFVGPLFVGTPNVFLDPGSLNAALLQALPAALAQNPDAAQALAALDQAPFIGGRNGTPAEEIAALVATGVAGAIPFGTVSPTEAFDPTAVVLMRRNFGSISLFGLDVSVTQYLSRSLQVGGSAAWVSDDTFRSDGGVVSLNAPRRKGSLFARWQHGVWTASGRFRSATGFPVRSDVYVGRTEAYGLVDIALGRRVRADSRVSLTIQNLTDQRHRQFVDVAEIGRVAMLQLEVGF